MLRSFWVLVFSLLATSLFAANEQDLPLIEKDAIRVNLALSRLASELDVELQTLEKQLDELEERHAGTEERLKGYRYGLTRIRNHAEEAQRIRPLAEASKRVIAAVARDIQNAAAKMCQNSEEMKNTVFPKARNDRGEENRSLKGTVSIQLEEARDAGERLARLRQHLSTLRLEASNFTSSAQQDPASPKIHRQDLSKLEIGLRHIRTMLVALEVKKTTLEELARQTRGTRSDEGNEIAQRILQVNDDAVEKYTEIEERTLAVSDRLGRLRDHGQWRQSQEIDSVLAVLDGDDSVATIKGIYKDVVQIQEEAAHILEEIESNAATVRECFEIGSKAGAAPIQIVIPDLTGMTETEALDALEAVNLRGRFVTSDVAPDHSLEGRVKTQRPAPGLSGRPRQEVVAVIFGPLERVVSVPDIRDMHQGEAQRILSQRLLGISMEVGDPAPAPNQEGFVQSQTPTPGTLVSEGAVVRIQVYGPYLPLRTLPNVIGGRSETAEAILEQLGFRVAFEEGPPAPDVYKQGLVLDQVPLAGTRYPEGGVVTLTVYSVFLKAVTLPDLVGLSRRSARMRLDELGLKFDFTVGGPAPVKGLEGLVYAQYPSPGTEMDRHTEKVILSIFGEPQLQAPPVVEVPPSETKVTEYYVVCRAHFPELPRDFKAGQKFWQIVPTFAPDTTTFVATGKPFLIHVSDAALEQYPAQFFKAGQRYSTLISAELKDLQTKKTGNFTGALLFEAVQIFRNKDALLAKYPDAVDPRGKGWTLLRLLQKDGRFTTTEPDPTLSLRFSGGPITTSWTRAMKAKNIELFSQILRHTDCFIVTAVYQSLTAPQLQTLRRFRDEVLVATPQGQRLVALYNKYGPMLAAYCYRYPQLATWLRPWLQEIAIELAEADPEGLPLRMLVNTLDSCSQAAGL